MNIKTFLLVRNEYLYYNIDMYLLILEHINNYYYNYY